MKILKITLENLASYDGRYTIDFTIPPLRDAGLYSIVGATGSGKSTILDAICLALYGKAPRFEGATDLKYFDNKEQHTKERSKILLPGDTRNILRKGAKEGRAEVDFIANDGLRYRAIWYAKHGTKQYAPRERTLIRYTPRDGRETEETLFRRNADSPLFQQVIGLDYDQFTRTIMLAQNSFANFIKCDGKEKARLLEKLTGTEIYTKIATRINARFKEAQSRLNEFNIRLEGDRRDLLEDSARDACNAQVQASMAKEKELEEEEKAIERSREWLKRKHSTEAALHEDQAALDRKLQEGHSHAEAERQLAVYNSLGQVSPLWGTYTQLQSDLAKSGAEQENARAGLEKAVAQQKEAEQCATASKARCEAAEKETLLLQPLLKEARRIQSLLEAKATELDKEARRHHEARQKAEAAEKAATDNRKRQEAAQAALKEAGEKLAALTPYERPLQQPDILQKALDDLKRQTGKAAAEETAIRQVRTTLATLTATVDRLKAERDNRKKSHAATGKQLQELEAALEKMDGNAIRKATLAAKDSADSFKRAAECWVDYFRERRRVATLRQQAGEYAQKEAQLRKTGLELKQQRQKLEEVLPGLQTAYNLLVGENVEKIRTTLQEGTPCPVCGAVHHPYAARQEADAATRLLHSKLEATQALKNDLETRLDTARGQFNAISGTLAGIRRELQAAEESLPEKEAAWKAFRKLDASLAEDIPVEDKDKARLRYAALKESQTRYTALYEESLKKEEAFAALEAKCKQARSQKDAQLLALQETEAECNRKALEKVRKEQELEGLLRQLQESKDTGKRLTGELDSYGLEDNWKDLWRHDPDAYAALWDARAATRKQAVTAKEQADTELKTLAAASTTLQAQASETDSNLKESCTALKRVEEDIRNLRKQLNAFWDGKRPDEVEQACTDRLTRARAQAEQDNRTANEAHLNVEKLRAAVKDKNLRLNRLEAQRNGLRQEVESTIHHYGLHITFEELPWYFNPARHWEETRTLLTRLKGELKELEGRIKAAESQLALIEKETNRTDLDENTLKERLSALQTAISKERQSRQEWLVQLENDRKAGLRLKESADTAKRLQKAFADWGELNKLMGANQGDDVRQAAQCYTLQFLVAHANRQLRMLTSRYRLVQVPDSLSLRIKDMDYAGEERNISSLSGGETFLVSLALALGLSAISSGNHNYGMLFIDEGFGTLDQESLNTVIDALSTLQSIQGKKVGVISHTPEMRERVPVQIQVIKGNADGKSRLRVV